MDYTSLQNNHKCQDLLRLSDREQHEILRRLDSQAGVASSTSRREDPRYPFRPAGGLMVGIEHPGRSQLRCLVRPRSLSRSGIGFLHGSFVYPGSPCFVILKSRANGGSAANGAEVVRGTVRHCRLIGGRIHEVGVKFDRPINLEDFLDPEDAESGGFADTGPESLDGHILLLDACDVQRELMRFQLVEAGAQVQSAANAQEAMQRIKEHETELLVVNLREVSGESLANIKAIRHVGYSGPVVVWLATCKPLIARRFMQFGADLILDQSCGFETLRGALNRFLRKTGRGGHDGSKLLSTHWTNEAIRPLILRYLEALEDLLVKLEEAISGGCHGRADKLCQEIAGQAQTFGFPAIVQTTR
ncbi:MAG: hypothetical protein JJU36_04170, partial [Phycisphaeraceae bacterium]|nr:hypothetical protein [Phycisphaeraceae bacterium]